MCKLLEYFSESDKQLLKKFETLYRSGNYLIAFSEIKKRLSSLTSCKTKNDYLLKLKLAGLLIDIADVSGLEDAALTGFLILSQEKENVKEFVPESNMEYNLGNAKSTMYKIQQNSPRFVYCPQNLNYLIESKNHYWKAYKSEVEPKGKFAAELVVNLANSLSKCGRVVEALQYYDMVLLDYPDHPEANASRSKELLWLNKLTGSITQNLLFQSMNGYKIASKATHLPSSVIEYWKNEAKRIKTYLEKTGYEINKAHIDKIETNNEYKSLSNYRKFCISEKLTLSEHALYCNCIGARRDDLIICSSSNPIGGDYIPQMEKVLNRLKSEYSFARLLYYYATNGNDEGFISYDQEVMFTELYDSEYLSSQSEMLRTSFRLNFGILDRIASAICYMYNLSDKNEQIYFEKFWNPKNKNKSVKQKERWDKINSKNNVSLVALYTQATDLNAEFGEWSFFKLWRNDLEHNQLSLINDDNIGGDMFNIYKKSSPFHVVSKEYFQIQTLHMLRFTRSAIFNFVFLIRNEADKELNDIKEEKKIAVPFTLHFRNDFEAI